MRLRWVFHLCTLHFFLTFFHRESKFVPYTRSDSGVMV